MRAVAQPQPAARHAAAPKALETLEEVAKASGGCLGGGGGGRKRRTPVAPM